MPQNFLGLEPGDSAYESSRFVVLPVPYDSTVSFQTGTRNGPGAIIEASRQLELFDEELLTETYKAGVCTLDALEPRMDGPAAMHEAIHEAAAEVVADGKFLFGLGGEHGITSGLVRAVAGKHGDRLSILQIDAHLDLRDSYQDSPWSHASVMRRCLNYTPTIVPVGIRNVCLEEHVFLGESGIKPVYARDCRGSDAWMDRVLSSLTENVYVTIDIDGLDPAYAPGTGTPEPGGLDWYQLITLLRRVAAAKRIVAADVVEVMPIPGQAVTEFLAGRLAYRLMGYVQAAETGNLRQSPSS